MTEEVEGSEKKSKTTRIITAIIAVVLIGIGIFYIIRGINML